MKRSSRRRERTDVGRAADKAVDGGSYSLKSVADHVAAYMEGVIVHYVPEGGVHRLYVKRVIKDFCSEKNDTLQKRLRIVHGNGASLSKIVEPVVIEFLQKKGYREVCDKVYEYVEPNPAPDLCHQQRVMDPGV